MCSSDLIRIGSSAFPGGGSGFVGVRLRVVAGCQLVGVIAFAEVVGEGFENRFVVRPIEFFRAAGGNLGRQACFIEAPMQDQERVGFNDVHDAVPDGGEEGNVDNVSVGVFEADIPHWLHVFFRQQDPDGLNDSSDGDLPLVRDFIELMNGDSAVFPEGFLVGAERMIRDEKAEKVAFPEEFFVFVDRGGFLEFDMDRPDRHQFEHVELAGFLALFIRAAGGDNPVQSDEELPSFAEVVERSDFDQAFQRPATDEFQVDAFREIVEVLKWAVFAANLTDRKSVV